MEWATKTRPALKLADGSDLDGTDALAALQAAASAIVATNPKRADPVAAALNGLSFELRQLTQLHYLMAEIPVRIKSRFAGTTPAVYYTMLGTAKEFISGYLAAAAIDARLPSTERKRGTMTLLQSRSI